jgi:hypothetical protein
MSSKNRLLSKLISNTGKVKEASLSATDIASTISKSSVTIDTFKDIDLTVQPEVLEIQVDDPTAGHTGTWLWTWLQSSLPYARATITNSPQLSVPLYKQGTYQINNFAKSIHGSMTQTHDFKLKWIEGTGDQNLIEDWVTYATVTDNHPDIDSGTSHSITRLSVNVPSVVTPPTLTAPTITYTVGNSGSGAYTFTGTANGSNPQLGPVYRGGTYTFNISATGHPFYLTTDNGTNYSAGTYFGEYTSGVTGSRTDSGTLTFVVPAGAPDVLYYQCGNHSPMRGTIVVKDLAVATNENGNYIIYGQHDQEEHVQAMEIRPIPTLTSQMCLVYDASNSKFVPQDLATYVENTPAFKNKIKEVAGTATLVAADGTSLVASVNIYSDATYLPQIGNVTGDIAFASDTEKLYIWSGSAWIPAAANIDLVAEGVATQTYVNTQISAINIPSAGLSVSLNQAGELAVTTGTVRWYAPAALTVSSVIARLGTAADATVGVNIKRNGSSVRTVSLAAAATSVTGSGFTMTAGQYLTIDVTSVGTTAKGNDLNVQLLYTLD